MTFEPIIPIWALLAVACAGIALAWFQYLRRTVYGLRPTVRVFLFSLRVAIFLVFAFLLSNPQWTRETSQELPPRLLVLFDASESMNSLEGPGKPTAFAKLQEAFFRTVYPLWENHFQLRFYTFSSQVFPTDPDSLQELDSVSGSATDIRGAVTEVLSQQGNNPPAAVMLLTDGNHNWGPDPTADIFRGEDDQKPIPLIAVSTEAYGELKKSLAIPQMTVPDAVFSKEETDIRFQIVASGAENVNAQTELTVEFNPEPEVWKEVPGGDRTQSIRLLGSSTEGSFTNTFEEGGRYRLTLETSADGLGSASAVREIQVEPGRWKIAYFSGRAGWFSASLIRRIWYVPRYSMKAAIGLGPGKWVFLESGAKEEENKRKEFLSFDEIAHEADLFVFEGLQPEQVVDFPTDIIRERIEAGAAVLFVAGAGEPLPYHFLESRGMDTIAPVDLKASFYGPGIKDVAWTDGAAANSITNSPILLGLPDRLPPAHFSVGAVGAIPEAETLLESSDGSPALAVRTVGESRSAFVAITDLWRWQFQPGDEGPAYLRAYGALLDRLLRWLILGEVESEGRPQLIISQSRVPLGKPIEVGVQYSRATEEATATVRLNVKDPAGQLIPIPLQSQAGGFFSTRYAPAEAGEYTFYVADPEIPSASDQATVSVEPFSIETAVSGARVDMLQNLASETEGVWVDLKDMAQIPKMDKVEEIHKPRIIVRSVTEPVMSAPWFFLILVVLACLEWTVRRLKDLP